MPWRAARHGRGMLVTRGRADAVAGWAGRGLVPVHVVPFGDWTVVQPAGPSLGHPPYDDEVHVLAARPVPGRLRPAIGLFAVAGNAVVTMHPPGWRAVQRWVVWVPRRGVVSPDRLAAGRPGDLARTAGADRAATRSVVDALRDPSGDAGRVLGDLCAALGLPGSRLLDGHDRPEDMDGYRLVEPGREHVARFHAAVDENARWRAEMEET